MRAVPFPGHNHSVVYPATAINADFGAADGSVQGLPALLTALSLTGQGRGFVYYRNAWYVVQGTSLYYWTGSGAATAIAQNLPAIGRAYFVPLANELICVIGGEIYKIQGTNAQKVVPKPSPPTVPSYTTVYFTVDMATFVAGTLTYQSETGGYNLQDLTNDPELGAHAYIGAASFPTIHPKRIGGYSVEINQVQQTASRPFNDPIAIQLVREISTNKTPITNSELLIPAPYRVARHRVDFYAPVTIDDTTGLRIWLNAGWRVSFKARVEFYNAITPRHYALTRVVNGVESDPVYFEIQSNLERYFVSFANLPAETWRLYRRDAAGVYRLVHEGTTTTYTDYKADAELGAELVLDSAPSNATLAIEWNRRAVLANGSQIYITDAGKFQVTQDGDIIDVQDTILALAVVRGVLYYGTANGWYMLYGWRETLTQMRVSSDVPPNGFVGDMLAVRGAPAGAFVPGSARDKQLDVELAYCIRTDEKLYWLTQTGELYIRVNGKWTKLPGVYRWCQLQGGVLWLQDDTGLSRLSGTRGTAMLEFTVPFDSPMQVYQLWLEGAGNALVRVQHRDGTWREITGTLPLQLDRIEHPYYALTLHIEGAQLHRLLLEMEPRRQLSKR